MSDTRHYVLDANVFIQAHRMHYAFDICPGFWNALLRQHGFERLCSIDRVRGELAGEGDALTEWVKRTAPEAFFKSTNNRPVIDAFAEMVQRVQNEKQYTPEAKAAFAEGADGWLVAFAQVNHFTVVTHEQYAPQARKNVKIPNVCVEFDVTYCDTFEMIRGVQEQFILKPRSQAR